MNKLAYEYSSTQIDLPKSLANEIIAWGRNNIQDKDLYIEPGEESTGRILDSHITLKYGLHDNHSGKVRDVLSKQGPIKYELGKISKFKDKDYDVIKVEVKGPDLHKAHEELKANTKNTETHATYNPHVTIAYVKKGVEPDGDLDEFTGRAATANRVTFSSKKNAQKENIMLKTAFVDILTEDITNAVNEKLAALRQRKMKRPKKLKRISQNFNAHRATHFAETGGTVMASAFLASLMEDLKTKPIDAIKTRLYDAVDSVASSMFRKA
jgi:2'-5' RNA ligase